VTNTAAYLAPSFETKKVFTTSKIFYSSSMTLPQNKLECLPSARFKANVKFASNVGTYPSEVTYVAQLLGLAPAFLANNKLA
jgi:hypothetical protein